MGATEYSTGAWPSGCTRCGRFIGDGYRNTWGWCLKCEETARTYIGKPTPDAVAYSLKLLPPAERLAVLYEQPEVQSTLSRLRQAVSSWEKPVDSDPEAPPYYLTVQASMTGGYARYRLIKAALDVWREAMGDG
jgi:predicted  nucleic acid-binding Zn-ribbon protein